MSGEPQFPVRLCEDMTGHEREIEVLAEALGGLGTVNIRQAEHVLRQLWASGMWIVDDGEHPKLMPKTADIGFGQHA
jgi:hypothetical protein